MQGKTDANPRSAEIKESLRRFSRESDWFHSNLPDLRTQFLGELVAVREQRVIGHNRKASDLLKELRRQGVELRDVFVGRVNPVSMKYVL